MLPALCAALSSTLLLVRGGQEFQRSEWQELHSEVELRHLIR